MHAREADPDQQEAQETAGHLYFMQQDKVLFRLREMQGVLLFIGKRAIRSQL